MTTTTVANQSKIFRIGTAKTYRGASYDVFVKAELKDGRLSLSGVEGPRKNDNCVGSCGQINMSTWDIENYAPGWNAALEGRLRKIWKNWHLNDMRAECAHQRARGENWTSHPSAQCPDCGYKLGSAWLREEVPQEILNELFSMPETDRAPAWV